MGLTWTRYYRNPGKGKTVIGLKPSVFRRSFKIVSNHLATFIDHSRNKFGVNDEIFIYAEIIFFGGLMSDDGG